MKEIKNRSVVLMSIVSCIVIIMLFVFFSSFSITKGTYGATSTNINACDVGYVYAENGYCCPTEATFVSEDLGCKKNYKIKTSERNEAEEYRDEIMLTEKPNECTALVYNSNNNNESYNFGCYFSVKSWKCSNGQKVYKGKCIDADVLPVTVNFYNGNNLVDTSPDYCVVEECEVTAPGPQKINNGYSFYDTNKEYEFTGWGDKKCLTKEWTGTYTAYHKFDKNSLNVSADYYACYKEKEDAEETEFDVNKCNYYTPATVTRDENYLNCKYINIGYNNSASDRTKEKVKACCVAMSGWTWVEYNFNSAGYDYEYCIKCEGTKVTCDPAKEVYDSQSACEKANSNYNCKEENGCWKKAGKKDDDKTPAPSSPSSSSSSSSSSKSSSSSSSSSTVSKKPSSSSNVDKNPPTGSVAIFMVWIISIGVIIYAFFYFKQSRFE